MHKAQCNPPQQLNSRIGKVSAAFSELDKVWRDHNINLDTKLKFYNACVLSTLLYACECRTLTERDEARLDVFDMHCQHNIFRVTWTQHNTNSSIRFRTKQPQLTAVIRKCCFQWFGHFIMNKHGLCPNKLYYWKPAHAKRRPGQTKTSWWEVIQKDINKMDLGKIIEEVEVTARERIM